MKKIAFALAVSTAIFVAPAFANNVEGTVEAIDRDRGLVMMSNGQEFVIPAGVNIGNFAPGSDVTIRFKDQDGEKAIESMRKAKPKDE